MGEKAVKGVAEEEKTKSGSEMRTMEDVIAS